MAYWKRLSGLLELVLVFCSGIYLLFTTVPKTAVPRLYVQSSNSRPITVQLSPWYGFSAYPVVSGQEESWDWILKFLDSIADKSPSGTRISRENETSINPMHPAFKSISLRFDGVKTVDLERNLLEELRIQTQPKITRIPIYDCVHKGCFGRKNRRKGGRRRVVFRQAEALGGAEENVIIHALLTDVVDVERIIVSSKNATTLVTFFTILPSQPKTLEEGDNFPLQLYDLFHRLFFDHDWIPETSFDSNCRDSAFRYEHGCVLGVTWKPWRPIESTQYFPPAGTGSLEMETRRLSSFLNCPTRSSCLLSQKFGGTLVGGDSSVDGQYVVCLDELIPSLASPEGCLVYSFGVSDDWMFDDAMHDVGCEVHSFDPSINRPSGQRNIHHWFHNWGLASSTSFSDPKWDMASYSSIRARLQHETKRVNVLKMDVEGAEWSFLSDADNCSLNLVDQFLLEIHSWNMGDGESIRRKSATLHRLEKNGFVLFDARVKQYGFDLRSLNFSGRLGATKPEFFMYELSFLKRNLVITQKV